ncbi:hypothetical protein MTR_3g067920 [Medicago truncatula]|uniref:Uncharacterized protein n=1 Tax=Medicago truncatula TaxID=3880 RepID=A0A072UZ44_MEDTR|nr:hypothetical protein MTR_3g067920 [Medicago truncatula]
MCEDAQVKAHVRYFAFKRTIKVSCLDLGADIDEDMWKTIYFPLAIHDDGDVEYMFLLMVEK